ncbi:hypothetical protein AALC16_10515 [Lachnospiraceae bacterium 29-91]
MINLKKIAAVTLAATMCMGLSVTAFAANPTVDEDRGSAVANLNNWNPDSPYYVPGINDDSTNGNGITVDGTNAKGEKNDKLTIKDHGLDPDSKAYNSINTAEEVADILAENGLTTKADSITPLAVVIVDGLNPDEDNVLTFTLSAADFSTDPYVETKYHPGDEVWGMFETGENTGVWEMRSGVVNADGKVDFKVDHKGAVILVKTMKNGRIVTIEKDSAGNEKPPVVIDPTEPDDNKTPSKPNQGTSNGAAAGSATTGTSPKTGEF